MSEWKKLKKEFFGKNMLVNYRGGVIDFSPQSMKNVKHGSFKSYNDYLNTQKRSCDVCRTYFEMCYNHDFDCRFYGRVKKVNANKRLILFSRIMVDGLYHDGIGFEGKEDHVWIRVNDVSKFKLNNCYSFDAEIYRYMKHGKNGKIIDYALQNLSEVEKMSDYSVPTDEELVDQQVRQLAYETSRYYDHLTLNNYDIINKKEFEERVKLLKSLEPGKFTPNTVLLAYELEYRMFLQTGGMKISPDDPDIDVKKRFIKIVRSQPVNYVGNVREAFMRIMSPDKPRLYVGDDSDDLNNDIVE